MECPFSIVSAKVSCQDFVPYHQTEPTGHGLHEWFAQQASQTPAAIAVVCEDRRLTYGDLDRQANTLAGSIHAILGGTQVPVGLAMERSVDLVVGILGILKAGCAYVPLDPAYPRERLTIIQDEARLSLIVTQRHLRDRLPSSRAEIIAIEDVGRDLVSSRLPFEPIPSRPDDLAYVIFTSGSTGRPKGVQVTHRNATRLFTATEPWFHFGPDDVWTLFHSYAFDFSVWELWGALLYGGRLVVVPHEVSRSPRAFHELLRKEKVTVLNQTPSAFQQLIHVDETIRGDNALSLKWVIFGGEALSIPTLKPWFDRHGDTSPRLVNMYGITETTVHVTYRPLGIVDLDQPADSVIGEPIPDLQVYLLDEQLQPVLNGDVGEMFVAGAGVATGYLNRHDLTAERFVSDPFSEDPDARMYRSGDLARRLPNGDLAYLGRIDHQVKIRGFRIELMEIEATLARHPSVRVAVVLAREDVPGEKRLVAYVVGRDDQPFQYSGLREFVKERLPDYMVPAAFVVLDELPLTNNGKVDRAALPAPSVERARSASTPGRAETETQSRLQVIWENLLQVQPIGIDESFFDLGGDSLLAMRMFLEIEKTFGRILSPVVLLKAGTITELAALLDRPAETKRWTSLVPLRETGKRPPFFCVHPLGGQVLGYRTLIKYLDSDQPFVGVQSPELHGAKPFESIEEMAAHYVADMMQYQPEGPFFLGGYSMGAIVAYEMARQLVQRGREVAFIGAIDDGPALCPWLPQRCGFNPFRFLANLPHWMAYQIKNGSTRQLLRDFSRKIRVATRKLGNRQIRADVEEVLDVNRYSINQRAILTNQYRILKNYIPGSYPGRVTAFRARTQSIWGGARGDLGWPGLAAGGVDIHVVPGQHVSIVVEPDVQILGEKLDAALRKSQM